MTKISCAKTHPEFVASDAGIRIHTSMPVDMDSLNAPTTDCCEYCIPEGTVWQCIAGKASPIPLNKVATAAVAGDTELVFDSVAGFTVGEDFGPPGNYGNITIAGTIAAGDVLYITVGSTTVMVTATATTPEDFAAEVGAALSANAMIAACVDVVVNGAIVHLFSKKGEFDVIALVAAFSTGAGTATVSGAELAVTSLGTILEIDSNTKTVTLDTPLPFDIPACLSLGSPFDADSVRGINCCEVCVEPGCDCNTSVVLMLGGSVYCNRVPGLTPAVLKALPLLSCAICC